jgi:hypothetical protein
MGKLGSHEQAASVIKRDNFSYVLLRSLFRRLSVFSSAFLRLYFCCRSSHQWIAKENMDGAVLELDKTTIKIIAFL